MDSTTHKIDSTSSSALTRVLDGIDRGHARSADRLHSVRNSVRDRIEHAIDRLEQLAHSGITALRAKVKLADGAAADGIIRAQGAVGRTLEKARHARTSRAHLAS
jgi:hypothetical protein